MEYLSQACNVLIMDKTMFKLTEVREVVKPLDIYQIHRLLSNFTAEEDDEIVTDDVLKEILSEAYDIDEKLLDNKKVKIIENLHN